MWHFETKPLWMLRAALRCSFVVWSSSGRWASPIQVSEQHRGRIDTKAGSHKTFNIIQSPLSHARSDNVTFKNNERTSAQEVHYRKPPFFLPPSCWEFLKSRMRLRVGENVTEKNGRVWHILLSPIVWVKSNGIIKAKPSWFHEKNIIVQQPRIQTLSSLWVWALRNPRMPSLCLLFPF